MTDATPPMTERQSKLKRRMILLVGIPLIVIIGAASAYLMGGRYISTDNAYVAAQKIIVTPSVAGRVISISVTEGQRVKPGDPLFVIDPGSYELAVKQADAHLAQTITGFESLGITLKSVDRQIELAKETLVLRQADSDRKTDLLATKATSKNDVDSANIALANARNALEALEAQRATTLAQLQGKSDLKIEEYAPYIEAKAARDRAIRDFGSVAVGGSDDLASPESAAGDQSIADIGPVIATRFGIDSRRPTEFTPRHDRHVFIESSFVQVRDQRMHPLVEHREMRVLTFTEVAGVKVPASEIERHNARTRLDQTSGHQELFQVSRSSIAVIIGIPFAIPGQ